MTRATSSGTGNTSAASTVLNPTLAANVPTEARKCKRWRRLRHSHIWISWGDRLEHIFCSPAQHQIHHSTDPRHHDRNFGGLLSLWDWLFGTLITARTRQPITFGLGAESDRYHTVRDMYFAPVREVVAR